MYLVYGYLVSEICHNRFDILAPFVAPNDSIMDCPAMTTTGKNFRLRLFGGRAVLASYRCCDVFARRRRFYCFKSFHTFDSFQGPFDFLPNFRNPCFKIPNFSKSDTTPINCLPYFYLVGAPKAGTTDLFTRMVRHPEISKFVPKEPHWLTRKRFCKYKLLYSLTSLKPCTNVRN